jgi:uncharacterized coiled-coil protein SlyX
MKKIIMVMALLLGSTAVSYGQQQVCISQEVANKCSESIDRVIALEDAVKERDRIIEGLKVEVAKQTQKAIDNEATVVRLTTLMEFLLKSYTKPKKFGIINF